jgi:hypothetical protein
MKFWRFSDKAKYARLRTLLRLGCPPATRSYSVFFTAVFFAIHCLSEPPAAPIRRDGFISFQSIVDSISSWRPLYQKSAKWQQGESNPDGRQEARTADVV